MSVDSIPKMKLHDPSHAVDDYLDRLLDDSVLPSQLELPPEQESSGVSVQADANEPNGSRRPEGADEPSIGSLGNELSPSPDAFSQERRLGDKLPDLITEESEASTGDLVNEQLDDTADSEEPLEQSMALLKFQVMGINFAVPQDSCMGDYPCPNDIDFNTEGPKWLLSEILVEGERARIVDIASIVIPDSRRESLSSGGRLRCTRVLGIAKADWGIVCEGNVERIDVPTEEIRWRTNQGKRQWLAGTIVKLKCALLDVKFIESMLDH